MSKTILMEAVGELPYALRDEIEGYTSSVLESSPEIFREAGLKMDPQLLDEFVFFAGLRRLWSLVNGRYWLLDRSLGIAHDTGVKSISVGGREFKKNAGDHRELRLIRQALLEKLTELKVAHVVQAKSLQEMLSLLRTGDNEPR